MFISDAGLPFKVLLEDESIFVLDKPAGLHSVVSPRSAHASVAGELMKRFPELERSAAKPEDGGLVQRLDFETSGCLLGAKNRSAWESLYRQLKEGGIKKRYLGIAEGRTPPAGKVESLIGAAYRRSKKVQVLPLGRNSKRALPAHTEFVTRAWNEELSLSLVEACAHAARRHQIRAHLASLGHPLAGDSLYGSKCRLPSIGRAAFFLHAFYLEIRRGQAPCLTVVSPLPRAVMELFPQAEGL